MDRQKKIQSSLSADESQFMDLLPPAKAASRPFANDVTAHPSVVPPVVPARIQPTPVPAAVLVPPPVRTVAPPPIPPPPPPVIRASFAAPPPKRRASRKVMGVAVLLAINIAFAESASWAAYWLFTGEKLSVAAANQEKEQIAEDAGAVDMGLLAGDGDGKLMQFVAHPYLGFIRQQGDPNAVPGQAFLLGERPLIVEPAEDEAIVGIFGGSVAEQFSRAGLAALRDRLEADPRFKGKRLTVFTAAIGGYKQPQQLMALNYFLTLGQHFDLIVNIDGFNDIAGPMTSNKLQGVSPYYPTGWAHIADRLPDLQTLSLIGSVTNARQRRQEWARTMLSTDVFRRSATAQLAWKLLDRKLASRMSQAQVALAQAPNTGKEESVHGTPYVYTADSETLSDLVGFWERSSVLMRDLASAHDIPYLHFLQPNQYLPGSKQLSPDELRYAHSVHSPYYNVVPNGYPLLQEAGRRLRDQGVEFYDLTALFKNVDERVYSDDCCHLNARGNELLGAAVGTAVMESFPRKEHASRP